MRMTLVVNTRPASHTTPPTAPTTPPNPTASPPPPPHCPLSLFPPHLGLGAQGKGDQARNDGCCGASRAAAGALGDVPGVFDLAAPPHVVKRQLPGGQLGHVHRACGVQAVHDTGALRHHAVVPAGGAPRRGVASQGDDILQAVRDAVQGAPPRARVQLGVGSRCLGARQVGRQRYHRLQRCVVSADTTREWGGGGGGGGVVGKGEERWWVVVSRVARRGQGGHRHAAR